MPPSLINLGLVVGLWLALVAGCCKFGSHQPGSHNSAPSPSPSPLTTGGGEGSEIPAVDLFNEWKMDKDAAEVKYKNKILVVSGKIRLVNERSIVLNSGEKRDILGVQCVLSDTARGRASGLSEGQTLTVEGLCVGRIGNIVLQNCTIRP